MNKTYLDNAYNKYKQQNKYAGDVQNIPLFGYYSINIIGSGFTDMQSLKRFEMNISGLSTINLKQCRTL